MKIKISLNVMLAVLIGIAIGFVLIHLYLQIGRYTPGVYHRARLDELFHLGKESTIPAWYSSGLLAFSSLLLFIVAGVNKTTGGNQWWRWQFLAWIFLYLSADESAILHERAASYLASRIPDSPLMIYGWIVPGIILLCTLGVVYVPFVLALPVRTRSLTILAGVIFLGGAVGVEFCTVLYETKVGPGMGLTTLTAVEEFFEMCGASLFIYTLFDYIRHQMRNPGISLEFN